MSGSRKLAVVGFQWVQLLLVDVELVLLMVKNCVLYASTLLSAESRIQKFFRTHLDLIQNNPPMIPRHVGYDNNIQGYERKGDVI